MLDPERCVDSRSATYDAIADEDQKYDSKTDLGARAEEVQRHDLRNMASYNIRDKFLYAG